MKSNYIPRRQPGPRSRLKNPILDPLERFGLPSKGDKRLLDAKTQEEYYSDIVERWRRFCEPFRPNEDELDRALASLHLAGNGEVSASGDSSLRRGRTETSLKERSVLASLEHLPSSSLKTSSTHSKDLDAIIMAMRKLREGLVASGRHDELAQHAYTFIIRASILTLSFESYHPALLRLLHHIHSLSPLSMSELQEFAGLHVLDLACRQNNFGEALQVRKQWAVTDERVEGVVKALVRNDWMEFWRLFKAADGYQRRLMAWAEEGVRQHALKCIGRTYFTVEKAYVEHATGRSWEDLVTKDGVTWELEGETAIVRRVKKAVAR